MRTDALLFNEDCATRPGTDNVAEMSLPYGFSDRRYAACSG